MGTARRRRSSAITTATSRVVSVAHSFVLGRLDGGLGNCSLRRFITSLLETVKCHASLSPRNNSDKVSVATCGSRLPPEVLMRMGDRSKSVQRSAVRSLGNTVHRNSCNLFIALSGCAGGTGGCLSDAPVVQNVGKARLMRLVVGCCPLLSSGCGGVVPLGRMCVPITTDRS